MSTHELVWTYEADDVTVQAVCHAPVDADCRLVSGSECECECVCIERDERGTFHLAGDFSERVRDRHDMHPGGECNVCLWLNEDPRMLAELSIDTPSFEVGRTPFEPVWTGDEYAWKRAES